MDNLKTSRKRLALLDEILSRKILKPKERELFSGLRNEIAGYLEVQRQQYAWEALKKEMWRQLGQQTPEPFLGERQLKARRRIPGAEGSGVTILPEETPRATIRDFLSNPSYQDRMIVPPGGLGRRKDWEL